MPGLRPLLEAELPDVQDALRDAGASRFDLLHPLPPFPDQSPRPIDDKFWTFTARRLLGEWVFANAAEQERRVTVRRGIQVAALLTGAEAIRGVPHVTGVRTLRPGSGQAVEGEELRADLVVDASGRQSRSLEWLNAIGATPPYEEQSDCGFTYYTRSFSGTQPDRRGSTLAPIGTISMLTLPGDNGTCSVTIFAASGDQPLKMLRHEEQWTRTVRACPMQARWLNGEPITGVLALGGVVDRYRRFVVNGSPVATGFAAVADAWGCESFGWPRSDGRPPARAAAPRRPARDAGRRSTLRRRIRSTNGSRDRSLVPRAARCRSRALRRNRSAARGPAAAATRRRTGARDTVTVLRAGRASRFCSGRCSSTWGPHHTGAADSGAADVAEGIRAACAAMPDGPPRPLPGPDRQQLLDLVR